MESRVAVHQSSRLPLTYYLLPKKIYKYMYAMRTKLDTAALSLKVERIKPAA